MPWEPSLAGFYAAGAGGGGGGAAAAWELGSSSLSRSRALLLSGI